MPFARLRHGTIRQGVLILAASVLLAGCQSMGMGGGSGANDPGGKGGPPPQISGVALPDGYSLDANRTIILGEGDRWIGRLSYSVSSSADDMFDFIRREMLNHGWSEVAVVRAETSLLTYLSGGGDRVASILIQRSTLYGSKIDMTVSPSAGSGVAPARASNGRR
ncbi:hypothetical protein [Ferrovibrio sp.]|uniref:hypothetical protein n=1 Tax=Ferrovibrio sp. TaxID=1917215 RepID=UPI0035B2177C